MIVCPQGLGHYELDFSEFEFNLQILGAPAVLKNSKRIITRGSRPMLISSTRALAYVQSATMQLRSQWRLAFREPLRARVFARMLIYMPTRRRCDLSNSYQAAEDALQAAGVLEDDAQIAGHDGSRLLHDPARPRIEIRLTAAEELRA